MTSSDFRKIAWESLRKSYWYCLGVSVLYTIIAGFGSVFGPLATAYAIFVGYPLSVGFSVFFINNSLGIQNIGDLFQGFKRGYLNSVLVLVIAAVKIFLWSLLFIIPGVVKSFEYAMIPFILAENPDTNYNDAFDLSRKMMDGNKWDLFVLNLSFIGWILLAIVTCGIGFAFLEPYIMAANTEFYMHIKNAQQTNIEEIPDTLTEAQEQQ